MVAAYLYLNAALYLLFAAWCTLSPASTANNLGYESLASGGRSEYLVIYGGLQLGLTVMFALVAMDSAYHRLGLKIALGLYGPIVLYRLVTVLRNWPVGNLTLATGALEALLFVAAVALYVSKA